MFFGPNSITDAGSKNLSSFETVTIVLFPEDKSSPQATFNSHDPLGLISPPTKQTFCECFLFLLAIAILTNYLEQLMKNAPSLNLLKKL